MKIKLLLLSILMFLVGCSDLEVSDVNIIAHRGASTIVPEHTIVAYEKAIEEGATFIEIDLRMTKDGELVAIHDDSVDRTTNGKGKVQDLTLEELQKLDAGSWFDEKYRGLKVPTLDEVFSEFGNETKYYIETRLVDKKTQMEKKVEQLITKHGIEEENIVLQSWYENSLREFDDKYTKIKLFN